MFIQKCIICQKDSLSPDGKWNDWPLFKCNSCGVNYLDRKSPSKISKVFKMFSLYKNWHTALLDRLNLLSPQPLVYKLKSGYFFLVYAGTHDVQVINEIWIDEIYNPWKEGIQRNWLVVDFGGHRGIFAIYAGRFAEHVYSIEANPETASFFKVNVTINNLTDRVTLQQGAISSTGGTADFYIPSDAGMSSFIKRIFFNKPKTIKVKKVPIEEFLSNITKVHLLKIDIEGAEFELFNKKCANKWLNKVERIAMEYHEKPSDIYFTLNRYGFKTILWLERNILYAEHSNIWRKKVG